MVRTNLGVGILFFPPRCEVVVSIDWVPTPLKVLGHKAFRHEVLRHKARRAEKEIGKGGNTHRKQIVSPERSGQEKSHEVKLRSVSRAFSSHNTWENEKKALHTAACAATAQSKAQIPFWWEHNDMRTVQTAILQAFGRANQSTASLSIQWREDIAERERIVLVGRG